MAKKKKEVCPYCGKSFAYLSRHKCKIKERVEGVADDKTNVERRIERIEEKKKKISRNLKKDEKVILRTINEIKDIYFEDLLILTNKDPDDLEEVLEILSLQSKIRLKRELVDASWTKHIFSIVDYEEDVSVKDADINREKDDFIWNLFARQPCFICTFFNKCNETNLDNFNPQHCTWLTEWIEHNLAGKKDYTINFDLLQEELRDV